MTAAPSPRARAWAEAVLGGSAPTTEAASSGRRGGVALSVAPALAPAPPPPPVPVAAELDAEGARVRAALAPAPALKPGARVALACDVDLSIRSLTRVLPAGTEVLVLSVGESIAWVEYANGLSFYVTPEEVTP